MYVGAKVYLASYLLHEEAEIVPALIKPRVGCVGPPIRVVLRDRVHLLLAGFAKLLALCGELSDIGCPGALSGCRGAGNPFREQAVFCEEGVTAEANGGSNDGKGKGGVETPRLFSGSLAEGSASCFDDSCERSTVAT
jgi:hypothetical protein